MVAESTEEVASMKEAESMEVPDPKEEVDMRVMKDVRV